MSMQQIMRWGHGFPKEWGGKLFKTLGQWGKEKCKIENPSNPQLPILSFSPIIKFFQNVVELVIAWSGKSMGTNSNWAEDPFLKNMF